MMNIETQLKLFLESNDLPSELYCVQDDRRQNSSDSQALYEGLAVWMSDDPSPIFRLVDIRWVFQTEAQADAFHKNTLLTNSEGATLTPNARKVGTDCYVFGGDRSDKLTQMIGEDFMIREFFYIFRVVNVVAKLYVAEEPMDISDGQRLNVEMVGSLAERAVKRINSALENPD